MGDLSESLRLLPTTNGKRNGTFEDAGVDVDDGDVDDNGNAKSIHTKKEWRPYLVEIPFFFYMLAIWPSLPLNEQYVFVVVYRTITGVDIGLEEEGCAASSKKNWTELATENYVKSIVSNWVLVFNACETLPAIFVSLVLCSYGDKYGRRLGLLLPSIGGCLKIIGFILVDVFNWDVAVLTIPNLIEGISGSHMTVTGAAFAYAADIVPLKHRTFRFAVLNSLLFAASAVGNVFMGLIAREFGFVTSFLVIGVCYLIAALYVLFLLPESVDTSETITVSEKEEGAVTVIKNALRSTAAAFKIYSKPRKDKKVTYRLYCMLGASTLHAILILGQVELDTLFLLGAPFCFDSLMIGFFLAFLAGCSVVGPIGGTRLFQLCGLSDAMMGIIAGVSGFVAFMVQAFSFNNLMLFSVPILNFYSAAVAALSRAIMSKDVEPSEQGALQASVSSLNTVGDLVSVTLLIGLYSLTVNVFRGTVFIVIAFLCVLNVVFFTAVATCLKLDSDNPKNKEKEDETEMYVEEEHY